MLISRYLAANWLAFDAKPWYAHGHMARRANDASSRISLRVSTEVAGYLEQLSKLGIHGKTPTEVAKTLIGYEVERLIREGILTLRKNER